MLARRPRIPVQHEADSMLRLSIDCEGEFAGLAVVDTCGNNILYAESVRMPPDVPDKLALCALS
jgi:hypothetical protein